MKTYLIRMIVACLLPFMAACDNKQESAGRIEDPSAVLSKELGQLFDQACENRPKSESPNNRLAEEDVLGTLPGDMPLLVSHLVGSIAVIPTNQKTVTWKIRKWALDQTPEKAKETLKEIQINAEVVQGVAQLKINHPDSGENKPHYQTCLVLEAPTKYLQTLVSDVGTISSKNHEADLDINMDTGDIMVEKSGSGTLHVDMNTGSTNILQNDVGTVIVVQDTGKVNITQKMSAPIDIKMDTGLASVSRPKKGGFTLDAEVLTGTLSLPEDLPQPETVNTTGQKSGTQVNGGGNVIKIRMNAGKIKIQE